MMTPQIGDKVRYDGPSESDVWAARRGYDGVVVDSYADEFRKRNGEDPVMFVVYERRPLGYGLGYQRDTYHAPAESLRVTERAAYVKIIESEGDGSGPVRDTDLLLSQIETTGRILRQRDRALDEAARLRAELAGGAS